MLICQTFVEKYWFSVISDETQLGVKIGSGKIFFR